MNDPKYRALDIQEKPKKYGPHYFHKNLIPAYLAHVAKMEALRREWDAL